MDIYVVSYESRAATFTEAEQAMTAVAAVTERGYLASVGKVSLEDIMKKEDFAYLALEVLQAPTPVDPGEPTQTVEAGSEEYVEVTEAEIVG